MPFKAPPLPTDHVPQVTNYFPDSLLPKEDSHITALLHPSRSPNITLSLSPVPPISSPFPSRDNLTETLHNCSGHSLNTAASV